MEGYIAEIRLFAATFAPRNWMYCAGQTLSIAQNSALFSLLGTTFGGNGTTTFGIPDLRGRTAISPGQGAGLSSYQLGQAGGVENVTLNINQLPAHQHTSNLLASSNASSGGDPSGKFIGAGSRTNPNPNVFSAGTPDAPMAPGSVSSDPTGGGQPHSNAQPYLGMNYIICQYGIYPSRN
ncbi:MAG: tail fiber protein [Saprospiraceae bacterium]|nr:tail fiber protein [Saprospiraceae bacterium]